MSHNQNENFGAMVQSQIDKRTRKRKNGMVVLDLPPGYNAQKFIRLRENGTLSLPAAIDGGLAWEFKLSDVPDYTDFANLYDAYVIDMVKITYTLENNNPGNFPVLYWANDYDDANTPLLSSTVTTHQGCQMHAFSEAGRSVTLKVRPRALLSTYQSGVTSAYSWAKEGTIIDMANPGVPHYGIKTWLANANASATPFTRVRTTVKYYMRFIGQR